MIYRVVALLAVLALVVGIVLLSGPQHEASALIAPERPLHDPGYSATNAHLVQTGADGLPLYTLDAAQIRQQPNDGLVELQQVRLGFRDASGNDWTATALRGELAQNSGIVRLSGDVHVVGTLPGTEETAQMTSEQLAFDTNAQILSTQEPVTLVMSGRKLDARGLTANLKERRVQLESAVHGSFAR